MGQYSASLHRISRAALPILAVIAAACDSGDISEPTPRPAPKPDPAPEIYVIPVVVHVVHLGEPVGVGHNLSTARIQRQIAALNDDYRRKEGTRGFNQHPDGGDARIEFVLARSAPDGSPTNGIVRIDAKAVDNPTSPNALFDYYAHYSYWAPEHYLNIWTLPLPESTVDVFLGKATGPDTDLPGADNLLRGEPFQAEGVLINSAHFGESDIDSDYNLGRTLTHEIGHYLGLLHPWGAGDCEQNDFCEDTPPVSAPVAGCPTNLPLACNGQPVMVQNYMNYSFDRCMNTFTNDQIARMHHVLKQSQMRSTLLTSPGLNRP